jgi:hypothetical protein
MLLRLDVRWLDVVAVGGGNLQRLYVSVVDDVAVGCSGGWMLWRLDVSMVGSCGGPWMKPPAFGYVGG